MKPLSIPKKSAKQFLLEIVPQILVLFDAPQKILGFNVQNTINRQIYAMSEESAARKLEALKEMLEAW